MCKTFTLLSFFVLLTACAGSFPGGTQVIHVDSAPQGADCILKREGEILTKFVTPADIKVEQTGDDLIIDCRKDSYDNIYRARQGGVDEINFMDGTASLYSGWGIDSATSAHNAYSEKILITLTPTEQIGGEYGFVPRP